MAASPQVETMIEAITDGFSNFKPEHVVPDLEGFLEHIPDLYVALSTEWKKLSGRVEDELPIDSRVPESMRDMTTVIDGLADSAREVFATFKRAHEQELDQHYNPRPGEAAWNTHS